ncbi:MAG: RES family NAD+ phosphorylase [Cyclobacteriaceae bacterium]
MPYFRLYEKKLEHVPFGYGLSAARWNHIGVGMIYMCKFTSLNMLEHISIKGNTGSSCDWELVIYETASDDFDELNISQLTPGWNSMRHRRLTQNIGTQFIRDQKKLALRVPSARLPTINYPAEHNLIVNPALKPQDYFRIVDQIDCSHNVNNSYTH